MNTFERVKFILKVMDRAMEMSPTPDWEKLADSLLFYDICFKPNWKQILCQGCGDFQQFIVEIYDQDIEFWEDIYEATIAYSQEAEDMAV